MRIAGVWRRQQLYYRLAGQMCVQCGAPVLPSQRCCVRCRTEVSERIPVEIMGQVPLLERCELVPIQRREDRTRRQ